MNIMPLQIESGSGLPMADEARLILADLDAADALEFTLSLSEEERHRASRYHFAVDRLRFTAARGLLRKWLGQFIGVPPGDSCFSYGPRGKPALASPLSDIRFNISHSKHLAAFAFTNGCQVGVDVELIRPDIDLKLLSEGFLTGQEASIVQQAPPQQQTEVFLHYWTRAEAIAKMFGTGLADREPADDTNSQHEGISPAPVPEAVHVLRLGTQAIIALATSKPIQIIRASSFLSENLSLFPLQPIPPPASAALHPS
jgi:4'-phosphopantetheinyl transferase